MQNKKLKILTINVSDSSGGAARAAYRIHQAVNEAGVEDLFLVKNKSLADEAVIAVDSFETKYLFSGISSYVQNKIKNKIQQARWRPYRKNEEVFLSDLRSSSIHGALQKIDFDILHLHWINLRFLDLRELRKLNKPIVWTLHDCWPFTGICHYFYDCERYKQSCGNCPHLLSNNPNDLSAQVWKKKTNYYKGLNLHIVAPSNWLANAARESSLFAQFPVTVIPNPIDTSCFTPGSKTDACKTLGILPDKKYILFGAMNAVNDRNKGFAEFCAAMQYFELNFDVEHTEVLVFGSTDEPEMGIKSLSVKHLGMLHDQKILAAYRTADVMVVPSLSENLSNIIMESMACGTPVVGFNIGGNADMIDHKQNGYLAQPHNPEDMANGIVWCLKNNINDELSGKARNKVLDNFTMERVSKQYVELYKSILNNH
ncbi:MAG: glycosyltransferase family 4 protein [Paludibacter sp.]|nr:glycosyltransferase family 4 protein [Paludibacter sp.]